MNTNSNEYRNKFTECIKKALRGEDYKQTRDALVTVSNHGIMVPKVLDEKIWDEISAEHPIVADVTKVSEPGMLEITRHVKTTSETKATVHGEVYETPAEDNKYEIITLPGKDIRAAVEISYASANMSQGALEKYLIENLKNQLSGRLTDYIFDSTLDYIDDLTEDDYCNISNAYYYEFEDEDTGEKMGTWRLEEKALTYTDVCKTIGKCEGGSNLKIYTSRYQKFRNLIGMTDTAGQPVIHPKKGTILGIPVVEEECLTARNYTKNEWIASSEWYSIYGAMVVCDPSKILLNVITPLTIEITPQPKTASILITAYMRVGCTIRDPRALSCWGFANKATDSLPITKTKLYINSVIVDDDGNEVEYLYSDGDRRVAYHLDGKQYYDASVEEYTDWFINGVEAVVYKPGETVTVEYAYATGDGITTDSEYVQDLKTAYLGEWQFGEWQGEELTWETGDNFPWSFSFTLPLDQEHYHVYVYYKSLVTSDGTGTEATIMTLDYDADGNAIMTPIKSVKKRENVGNVIMRLPNNKNVKTKKKVNVKVKKA